MNEQLRVHSSPFAHKRSCTSCRRQYSVSLRRAHWAHIAFRPGRKFNQKWSKTAQKGAVFARIFGRNHHNVQTGWHEPLIGSEQAVHRPELATIVIVRSVLTGLELRQ